MNLLSLIKKSDEGNLDSYLKQIAESIDVTQREFGDVDLVIGPDYALTSYLDKEKHLIDFNKNSQTFDRLQDISYRYPNIFFIPGTLPLKRGKDMQLSAPLLFNGIIKKLIHKETDAGEEELARANGLNYYRGNFRENYFYIGDKYISVEICRDHGKQPLNDFTFLQLILSYDKNAGFRPGVLYESLSRYAVVCDSLEPFTEAYLYDADNSPHLKELRPNLDCHGFRIYNLEKFNYF